MNDLKAPLDSQQGFSILQGLIVLAAFIALMTAAAFSFTNSLNHSRYADAKSGLEALTAEIQAVLHYSPVCKKAMGLPAPGIAMNAPFSLPLELPSQQILRTAASVQPGSSNLFPIELKRYHVRIQPLQFEATDTGQVSATGGRLYSADLILAAAPFEANWGPAFNKVKVSSVIFESSGGAITNCYKKSELDDLRSCPIIPFMNVTTQQMEAAPVPEGRVRSGLAQGTAIDISANGKLVIPLQVQPPPPYPDQTLVADPLRYTCINGKWVQLDPD